MTHEAISCLPKRNDASKTNIETGQVKRKPADHAHKQRFQPHMTRHPAMAHNHETTSYTMDRWLLDRSEVTANGISGRGTVEVERLSRVSLVCNQVDAMFGSEADARAREMRGLSPRVYFLPSCPTTKPRTDHNHVAAWLLEIPEVTEVSQAGRANLAAKRRDRVISVCDQVDTIILSLARCAIQQDG